MAVSNHHLVPVKKEKANLRKREKRKKMVNENFGIRSGLTVSSVQINAIKIIHIQLKV